MRDDDWKPLEAKLRALREAWLDMPWHGIVANGLGDPIQRLLNAVTDIVDPDELLRADLDARRRGNIASLKSQIEWKRSAIATAEEWLASDMAGCRRTLEKTRAEVSELERQLAESTAP